MSTFTNITKNVSTVVNTLKGLAPASAGMPIGLLLALTYSGGQSIGGGNVSFTNQIKN